jgi:hypothetical protein
MNKKILVVLFAILSIYSYGCGVPTPAPVRIKIVNKNITRVKNVTKVKNVYKSKTINKKYITEEITNNTYNTYEEIDNVSLDLAFIGALEGSKNSIPLIDGGDKGIGFGIGGSEDEVALAISFQMLVTDSVKVDTGIATNFGGETVIEGGVGFRF